MSEGPIYIPKKGQDYVDYELIGGGPRDGAIGHMYNPAPRVLCKVPQADVYLAAACAPTYTELWHEYRLSRGTTHKLYYTYEGYTTNGPEWKG